MRKRVRAGRVGRRDVRNDIFFVRRYDRDESGDLGAR